MQSNSTWWQLHKAKASGEGVAVHKHHELSAGAVDSKVLARVVGTRVPKDTLKDGAALWDY